VEAVQFSLIILKVIEKEVGPDLTDEGAEDNIVVIAARMVFGVAVNTGTEVICERWWDQAGGYRPVDRS